jgi:NADH-quinone oxidoreductase E subunit
MQAIQNILNKYPDGKREYLIPILQEIQETEGFLAEKSVVEVGRYLQIPTSKIFGVATFYNQFRFEPQGKFHIQVCRGTACHVLGSYTVLHELEKNLRIKAGSTSRDGLFSLEVVACIGACGLAPVISINGEFHAKVTPASIQSILEQYKSASTESSERSGASN